MQRRLRKFFLKLSQTTVRISPMQTIVFAFLGIIFTGTLLLLFPFSSRSGESCGLMTATFTVTSATCVTGLSLVDTWTPWIRTSCGFVFDTNWRIGVYDHCVHIFFPFSEKN